MGKQNIYDEPGFFRGYRKMRESRAGLNDVVEQLALLSLLPDVRGKRVLDLGCGTGELCRRVVSLGAAEAVGVDISARMLEAAQQEQGQGVSYINLPMEEASFKPGSFDVVTSSLAFHYVEDFPSICGKIYEWLNPTGIFLFSMEHPISTCSQGIHHGWIKNQAGEKVAWPVDCYSSEGKRESHWFVQGVIKYHRTVATILNSVIRAGFIIQSIIEPSAGEEDIKILPELADTLRRPPFLLVKSGRPPV